MRFPSAAKHDTAVDAWLSRQPDELAALARPWFAKMRDCGDDVRELIHDGCPVACVDDVAFGYVNAFRSHVNVGFFHGAELNDPARLLEGTGRRMRHVKLRPEQPFNSAALGELIDTAYAQIKAMVRFA
jgi:hypothetical protein